MDSAKAFYGLLSGLSKRRYFEDATITDGFLQEELFADNAAEFPTQLQLAGETLDVLVAEDVGLGKLDAFLGARESNGSLPEGYARYTAKFWKAQRGKINQALAAQTVWADRLTGVSWRVDVKTRTKDKEELNDPTAVIELRIQAASGRNSGGGVGSGSKSGGAGAAAAGDDNGSSSSSSSNNGSNGGSNVRALQLEVSAAQLADMVGQIETIETRLKQAAA
eukprot:UC1_evm2s328